jgi:ABC-type multidrug transport system fused ATPase/permease subunit
MLASWRHVAHRRFEGIVRRTATRVHFSHHHRLHLGRYLSSSSSVTTQQEERKKSEKQEEPAFNKSQQLLGLDINNNINYKNNNTDDGDPFWRLVEISKKEWSLIALSASTLGVTSSVTLLLPYASGTVIDYTVTSGADGGVSPIVMATGLFGLTALAGGGVYLRTLWLAKAGNRIVARLKQQLYSSILQQETAYLDSTTTGDLMSRLTADAQLVQSAMTTQAVAGLRQIVMSTGSMAMLIYTSPLLAAISVGTLPPVFIMTRRYGRTLAKQQQEVQELLGEAASLAEQSLSNSGNVKQFVAEDYEANRYRNSIAKAHERAVQIAHQQAMLETGAHIAGNAAILGVLGFGGNLVLEGSMSAGDLTGFVMYSLLLAGNMSGLTNVYSDLVRAVAASNRIFEIVDRTPTIQSASWNDRESVRDDDDPLGQDEYKPRNNATRTKTTDEYQTSSSAAAIEIRNLNFSYPARPDAKVLKDFNLTVSPGEILSLVGGSGSGKSTVGSLLTRLYDPEDDGSQILINGRPVHEYDVEELRHMVGIVSQDPALVQGTIRENIAYGEWDNLSEDQIQQAAQQAHVLEFARTFPDGLDTMVGARGMQLSGGQRQRIALARVLAKSPPIIILDEATSALDAQSEHLVQQALTRLFADSSNNRQSTIISIAHRLSTIRHSSRIAVIQDGAVVQTGTFDELRVSQGPFLELMKTQLVGNYNDDN